MFDFRYKCLKTPTRDFYQHVTCILDNSIKTTAHLLTLTALPRQWIALDTANLQFLRSRMLTIKTTVSKLYTIFAIQTQDTQQQLRLYEKSARGCNNNAVTKKSYFLISGHRRMPGMLVRQRPCTGDACQCSWMTDQDDDTDELISFRV